MKNKNPFLILVLFSFIGILITTICHICFYNENKFLMEKKIIPDKHIEKSKGRAICINDECKNIGDIIEMGNEKFYVINNDGKNIQMITKYNLDIAGVEFMIYGDNLQNHKAKGTLDWKSLKDVYGGSVFAEDNYWKDSKDTYIYNENSKLYDYVERYVDYLNKYFDVKVTGSLLSTAQAETLGCSKKNENCSDAPKWLSSTSYWLGNYYDDNKIWFISNFYSGYSGNTYEDKIDLGVRPVITMNVNDLKTLNENINAIKDSILINIDDVVQNIQNSYLSELNDLLNKYLDTIYSVYD